MSLDQLLLEASRLGFIAEEKGGTLTISSRDGALIVGPGAPVTVEAVGDRYIVRGARGETWQGGARGAVVAAYMFYSRWARSRIEGRLRMVEGLLRTAPASGECESWASRLSHLDGWGACRLAILAAAAYHGLSLVDPEGPWASTPWASGASEVAEALARLREEARLAERIVELLDDSGKKRPAWIHAYPFLSLAAAIAGAPKASWEAALSHIYTRSSLEGVEVAGTLEVLSAARPAWAWSVGVKAATVWDRAIILLATTPSAVPGEASRAGARVVIDGLARHKTIVLGRRAWESYYSARLQGDPAAIYYESGTPTAAATGVEGLEGEYCIGDALIPLDPQAARGCATVKPSSRE